MNFQANLDKEITLLVDKRVNIKKNNNHNHKVNLYDIPFQKNLINNEVQITLITHKEEKDDKRM